MRTAPLPFVTLLTAVLLAVPAFAGQEALGTLFPLRAEIRAQDAGLTRLELTAEVIGACRADLADLRILAADGREIPYIVDSPEPQGVTTRVRHSARPEIVAAELTRDVVDEGVTVYRERFELALPTLPGDVPAWDLLLSVGRRDFVSRLNIVAVEPGGRRTPVITGGSVFRLSPAGAQRLRFTIPVRGAVRLEVFLESEEPCYLEPRFSLESSRFLPELGSSRVDLAIREVRSLVGTTEVVVDRPRGLVPRRLAITTSTDTFHRRITVWDEGPGADPKPLGVSEVLRIAALAPVEVLEIPLRAPRGDRLRLVIENQDSPALDEVGFVALMPRPVLVFSKPEGPASTTLYFGGGRARRPRYDLAALDPQGRLPVDGETVGEALAVLDPAQALTATLGNAERNPSYDASPVLAFAMHPGAAIDARRYEHRRRLSVTPSAEGLSRLLLVPSDLAVLRADLADLRIVDGEGRQWAYLRQDRARRVFSPLEIVSHRGDNRVSRYELEVPDGAMVVDRIDLEAEAPYFDRDFTLRGRLDDGTDRELARGRLVRRAGDPRPSTIAVAPRRVVRLELEISDGDDAPLVFARVEARSAAPDVYLAATAGEYDLLLGHPDAEAPVYELERIRSTILAVGAAEVVAGELESNPAFRAASRLAGAGTAQKTILWAVLGLAVIVLVVLTLRAAKQE